MITPEMISKFERGFSLIDRVSSNDKLRGDDYLYLDIEVKICKNERANS
jgi:hypothetical protein